MKNSVVAVLATLMIVCGPVAILTDSCYATTTENEIQIVQNGHDVVLTLSDSNPRDSVTWDLGDGRVIKNSSIETTFKSGFYLVQAIIDQPGKEIVKLQRYVAIYDNAPYGSVISASLNEEFKYGIYAPVAPDLSVIDSDGKRTSWLAYDANDRVLTGIPQKTGLYHVYLDDKYWTINVIDTGQSFSPVINFDADVNDNNIIASPITSDDLSRYSWSLRDFNGNLKSAHEGKNLNISAEPGYYILKLQQIGISGSTSYSQVVFIDGEIINDLPEDDEKSYVLPLILGIITIILLMIATITRNPIVSLSSIITAVIALLMVI